MKAIRIWRFDDAPEKYKKLSTHGGDEDWIAHVPAYLADETISWMACGTSFGWYKVIEYGLPDGSTVHIGAHS